MVESKRYGALGIPALLVVDWQRLFCSPDSPAHIPATSCVETNLYALVDDFSQGGLPVVASRHGHSRIEKGPFLRYHGRLLLEHDPLAHLMPALEGIQTIEVLPKSTYSPFVQPILKAHLHQQGVGRVVLCGVQTNRCVLATAFGAFDAGFEVIVIKDACAARHQRDHEAAIQIMERACARVMTTADLLHELSSGGPPRSVQVKPGKAP